jgi:hypothetical protein
VCRVVGKIHPGATLTPHFRDFLPAWLILQPWYLGTAAQRCARSVTSGSAHALITTADHSVLGTRYIYDGQVDPLWIAHLLRPIDTNGVSPPSHRHGVGPANAQGTRRATHPLVSDQIRVELIRALTPSIPPPPADVAGLLIGTWHPNPHSTDA